MIVAEHDWLWRRQQVIPVARDGSDIGPPREANRHVYEGFDDSNTGTDGHGDYDADAAWSSEEWDDA